jgi:hypothetical protein
MARRFGLAIMPLLLLACWGVWHGAGVLLGWLGLEALDLPARLCLLFLFLSAAEAGLARLPERLHGEH